MIVKKSFYWGKVEVKDVMIDFEGGLEEGVDVFINGKYVFNRIGVAANTITDDDIQYCWDSWHKLH